MNPKNPVEKLLLELDETIQKRTKNLSIIDRDYVDENGQVLSREYADYQRRRENVLRRFNEEALDIQRRLDTLCKRIRSRQPELCNLTADNIRTNPHFPNALALDKLHVTYSSLDFYVPRLIDFPLQRNLVLPREAANDQLQCLILRMLYTIPCGKISLHIFDPLNLGDSVRSLKALFTEGKIIPEKKVLSTKKEVTECLESALAYAENLIQNVFPAGCGSYARYNQMQRSGRDLQNTLPYHVYLFFDVPHNLDEPCMEMLRTLAGLSDRCGHLVILTYDQSAVKEAEKDAQRAAFDKSLLFLKSLIESSDGPDSLSSPQVPGLQHLQLAYAREQIPEERDLLARINDLREAYGAFAKSGTSFDDLMEGWSLFDRTSERHLAVPVGFSDTSNARIEMVLDDESTHYLIGGTTGSGKSNFLHILILSMCSRYSPEELELYLLDFKDGVEFSAYAHPPLPHARLVAMEADTEYGVSVLNYLISEKERRNKLFKEKRVKNIAGYRAGNFGSMPRIVLLVDEFQVLFNSEDRDNTVAGLNMLAKQGRSCGIHLVMATQSLADVNFSDTQFGGRVALRCSAEDSKLLMGGILTNNEAAADLVIPYAILNTDNGKVSGNRKFAVPRAEEIIDQAVRNIAAESQKRGFQKETTLFIGQMLPKHPEKGTFAGSEDLLLHLGETLEFPSHCFSIHLEKKGGNNLLVCGSDDVYRTGLMRSVFMSGAGCSRIGRTICVGHFDQYPELFSDQQASHYETMREWIRGEDGASIKPGTLLLLDGVNLHKEIDFDPYALEVNPEVQYFLNFLSESGRNSCHIVAFYERFNELKDSGLDTDEFIHRVSFGLNNNDFSSFTGDYSGLQGRQGLRALYSYSGKVQTSFKPYGERRHE